MKISTILSAALLTVACAATAQTTTAQTATAQAVSEPLWLRHSAISPDGQTIAFSYQGDLFTVSVSGGEAHQITSHAAYDAYPVWSPDGQQIAFASSREGSLDVYVIDRRGGTPVRLTTHSGDEIPMTFDNHGNVLFSASLMPTAQSNIFASGRTNQVYSVPTRPGARPRLWSTLPMEDVSINTNGDVLYHDYKGYEDPMRKHHQSPICRDIWLASTHGGSPQNANYARQTFFGGEDRTPRWADDHSFFYLSEQDGTMNIYLRDISTQSQPSGSATAQQLTRHQKNPVRHLSVSQTGTLCYTQNGEIYTLRPGQEPQKVAINICADNSGQQLVRQIKTSGATEIQLSPSGKEVAFVLRGDVFVTAVDYKTTRQITNTPEQERSICFAPDGRSLVYGAERGGYWQIYRSYIQKKDDKQFAYAADIAEERLTQSEITSMQPKYSPDGKEVAFLEDRGTLRIINLASRQVRTVMDGKYNFSYSDGDLWYEWSPDSKWLLTSYIGNGGWNNQDVALVSASAGEPIHNLTQSGYNDGSAKWVLGGKAMLFESDRAGYRSHGSWGAETDYYLMFFDVDAYDRFRMSKEEKVMAEEAAKEAAKENKEKAQENKKESKSKGKKPASATADLKFDLDNCRDRIVRLTDNSAHMGDAVLKGDTLYYQAAFEGDMDLWMHDLREQKTKLVMKDVGRGYLFADKECKNLFMCTHGHIKKLDLAKETAKNVDFETVFNYRPYDERAYLFDHIWQQVKDKFYEPGLHNTDWQYYRDNYRRFLPFINNEYDFRDMLSEMLGELNASHTGARYYPDGPSLKTAHLGVFLDENYEGDGLRISEVIRRSPLAQKQSGVVAGCIIEQVDGQKITAGADYFPLLDGKAGKRVRLTVSNPHNGKRTDVTIKAISQSDLNELLYKRWVDRNRKLVDSLSNKRLAYVHVKAMDSKSFRTVYSDLLNDHNRNCDAAIVDERHNGGGWLHDDLCTLLSGKEYQRFIPHGKYVGRDPYNKWVKPSCVLMCEDDYSNGHGFPWVYKELKIGQLIGTPVAGTMTAVWWETLQNGMVFGIPQVGCMDMRGQYGENNTLQPDVEVYNSPEDAINGRDPQLERAIKEMQR